MSQHPTLVYGWPRIKYLTDACHSSMRRRGKWTDRRTKIGRKDRQTQREKRERERESDSERHKVGESETSRKLEKGSVRD